jgi:hypothetical protein
MAKRPDVPRQITAPAGEELVTVLHATGWQIYGCQLSAEGKPAWGLKAPEAELRDSSGNVVGRHFFGPTWKLNDGSEVTAKLASRVDAPDSGSIPWLLLTVTGRSGEGILSRVTSIQRINTTGGLAPAECSAANLGTDIKVSYTADYYFYAPAGR